MQTENPEEFFDVGQANKKYGRVDRSNGAILLEKCVFPFSLRLSFNVEVEIECRIKEVSSAFANLLCVIGSEKVRFLVCQMVCRTKSVRGIILSRRMRRGSGSIGRDTVRLHHKTHSSGVFWKEFIGTASLKFLVISLGPLPLAVILTRLFQDTSILQTKKVFVQSPL